MAVRTRVRVRDLPLLADIGINPDEVGKRQPLVISIEVLLSAASVSEIEQTVDYRRLVRAAEDLALVHVPLIETFASRLAEDCMAMGQVDEVRVSVDKPFAIVRGLAGAEVALVRQPVGEGVNGG